LIALNYLHNGQKDLKGDPVISPVLVHQLLHLRLGGVLAQGSHHITYMGQKDEQIISVADPVLFYFIRDPEPG
jgi:hypothetical protein